MDNRQRLHLLLDILIDEMAPARGPEDGTVQSERQMQRYYTLRVQEARQHFEEALMSLMADLVAEAGGIDEICPPYPRPEMTRTEQASRPAEPPEAPSPSDCARPEETSQ